MLTAIEGELAAAKGLTVLGAQGQMVAHPLLGEARRSRAQVASLLKALGLEDPLAGGGRGGRTTASSARAAVSTRYGGRA